LCGSLRPLAQSVRYCSLATDRRKQMFLGYLDKRVEPLSPHSYRIVVCWGRVPKSSQLVVDGERRTVFE